MPRDPIPTWYYALVVVRKGEHFLLVHESSHGERWYLPAGRVEAGESLVAGACREVEEESGIRVEIEGILHLQHTPIGANARFRIIFLARPVDDTPLKQTADEHSQEAVWVTLADLDRYDLRSSEVRELFEAVEQGAPVYPLTLLGREGF
jgi:ADP-ribose pyrophosphatase YjhB (NUDIX family)